MNKPFLSNRSASALLLAAFLAVSGCASTGSSSSNPTAGSDTGAQSVKLEDTALHLHPESGVSLTGEIYMMRGLANIFSRGMDRMTERMRAQGYDVVSFNHSRWEEYAADIIEREKNDKISYPIIIMGHSLGANEAPQMANYLADHGIRTSLIIGFDPTEPQIVGKNVDAVINYYLPSGGNIYRKTKSFKGTLSNINVSSFPGIKHVNVEKNPKLQSRSIAKVKALTKPLKKRREG